MAALAARKRKSLASIGVLIVNTWETISLWSVEQDQKLLGLPAADVVREASMMAEEKQMWKDGCERVAEQIIEEFPWLDKWLDEKIAALGGVGNWRVRYAGIRRRQIEEKRKAGLLPSPAPGPIMAPHTPQPTVPRNITPMPAPAASEQRYENLLEVNL